MRFCYLEFTYGGASITCRKLFCDFDKRKGKNPSEISMTCIAEKPAIVRNQFAQVAFGVNGSSILLNATLNRKLY